MEGHRPLWEELMKKQVFNPYLPSYEYVPDGEPYVFGDRLYVYGSHDKLTGKISALGIMCAGLRRFLIWGNGNTRV